MSNHLDERELSAAVAGLELAVPAAEHLESCLECRRRVAELQQLIGRRRAEQTSGEPDWETARAAVLARLPGVESERAASRLQRWWRPLAAAAAVAAIAVAVGLLAPGRVADEEASTEIPVEEILAEVDAVLADDSIPGFELIDPGLETLSGVAADSAS
jgi:anti-sigma factor RsiW